MVRGRNDFPTYKDLSTLDFIEFERNFLGQHIKIALVLSRDGKLKEINLPIPKKERLKLNLNVGKVLIVFCSLLPEGRLILLSRNFILEWIDIMNWNNFKHKHLTTISPNDGDSLDNLALLFNKIVERRITLKISQQELAERTGLTQSAVARFEACGVMPRIDTVEKIAQALGCYLTINTSVDKTVK
ncbi:MAG: helix-turn-helix transcriptional regulator [Sporomusaceae bacterium]|jgi:DNA-binding XRE family transcriptional regulator|nr:helix-turn-helix transcriptional regulator [Sporomusaceae bacterium]